MITSINTSSNYYYFTLYSNRYYVGFNGSEGAFSSWTTGDHVLLFNGTNNEILLDNTTLVSGRNSVSTTNLWIGNRGAAACFEGKIYYVKITDKSTGNLVRYMIPVVQNNTGIAGMYDIVNDIFYTNAGTGSFTVPD